jgi:hypothetical protein
MYTYIVSNFAYDQNGYEEVISSIQSVVASALSSGAAYRNLASNLLYWMAWSRVVSQASTSGTQRFQVLICKHE